MTTPTTATTSNRTIPFLIPKQEWSEIKTTRSATVWMLLLDCVVPFMAFAAHWTVWDNADAKQCATICFSTRSCRCRCCCLLFHLFVAYAVPTAQTDGTDDRCWWAHFRVMHWKLRRRCGMHFSNIYYNVIEDNNEENGFFSFLFCFGSNRSILNIVCVRERRWKCNYGKWCLWRDVKFIESFFFSIEHLSTQAHPTPSIHHRRCVSEERQIKTLECRDLCLGKTDGNWSVVSAQHEHQQPSTCWLPLPFVSYNPKRQSIHQLISIWRKIVIYFDWFESCAIRWNDDFVWCESQDLLPNVS